MKYRDLDLEEVLADHRRENDLLEVPLGGRVFRAFLAFVFLALATIFVQLAYLGVGEHDFYATRARANIEDISVTPSPRGAILDRFGKPLVRNEPSWSAFLVPRHLPEYRARTAVIRAVSDTLGVTMEELEKQLSEKDWTVSDRLLISSDISQDVLVELSSRSLPGVEIEPSFKRVQEIPFKFSQLIGYVGFPGNDDLTSNADLSPESQIGEDGLEASYDQYLRGTDEKKAMFHNAKGAVEDMRVVQAAKNGDTLHTSIDLEFQEYFYQRLEEGLRELGRNIGVGIALDPRSGEVLALVDVPGFDSNRIKDFLVDPRDPLFNRAVGGLYNPGSTIKPLVATAALTEGVIDPAKQIFSKGYIEVPNPYDAEHPSRFLDWKPNGWVDLAAALARSSNIYFYEVGGGFEDQVGLGIARLKEWWQKFGLGDKTGIDLPGESSGVLPDPLWKEERTHDPWRLGDTYNVAIGQGDLSITPIELLNYVSAIANGGTFWKPRIVQTVTDEKENVLFENKPSVRHDITAEVTKVIGNVQGGMRDAVRQPYGTAHMLADIPLHVAAKTGTAQIENNQKTNAFFVGYAPYENPSLAILILVENSTEGSLNTVPVARDVFLWYYEHRLKGFAQN